MAFQTGLEGRPWHYGALAGLAVAALLWFGTNHFLLKPKRAEIEAQETRLAGLQAKIQEGRAAQQQLPRFREEVRRLELELDKLLRILPARRNTPELLRRVRALTEQGDFNLKRFRPTRFIEKDFYSEWPINIEDLEVTALRGRDLGTHTISANFKAKTFVYQDSDTDSE
jgi:type IV pilus assembly protein PilO